MSSMFSMRETKVEIVVEGGERQAVANPEQGSELPAEALEQREMDAAQEIAPTEAELQEQREMDAGEGADDEERLGEYRIFCDTRPAGSAYDIFCDGDGR